MSIAVKIIINWLPLYVLFDNLILVLWGLLSEVFLDEPTVDTIIGSMNTFQFSAQEINFYYMHYVH